MEMQYRDQVEQFESLYPEIYTDDTSERRILDDEDLD